MPNVSSARARIRSDPRGKSLKLVAITGYGSPEQRTKVMEAGFDLHLVKPVTIDDLAAALGGPNEAGP